MVAICRQIHRVSKLSSLINSLIIHAHVFIKSIDIKWFTGDTCHSVFVQGILNVRHTYTHSLSTNIMNSC